MKKNFIEAIKKNLQNNGFPKNKVTLPLEKMYEIADSKGLNFNMILSELEEVEGIKHQKLTDKILFYSESEMEMKGDSENSENIETYQKIYDRLKGMDKKDIIKNAQEILKSMSPEEIRAMEELYQKMTPEEQERLMKNAKDMG
ncbi:MAG: hypothetical protein HQK49_13530 [Oligoflexia bacterium]|nr:hypothetical protein [Oligoflexia bacterium]